MFRLPPELDDSLFAAPAPVRVASIREAHVARYAPVDPVATAAALPAELRRILLLAADDIDGRGYPIWALEGVAGWSEEATYDRARRLAHLGLVRMRVAEDDRDIDVIPTAAGRVTAALLIAWRS
ncbi:non-ribosomal peptide synthetase [Methylobacterium sp. SD21]|uniref:non-ribosomal peptide synthetase n=1 Tax=Methylobacterium litchii TaxID=3138810 RepID=UPI00313AB0C0